MILLAAAIFMSGCKEEPVELVNTPAFDSSTVSPAANESGTVRAYVGTEVTATFDMNSIDFTPIGDMVSTMTVLIMGSPDIDFEYEHTAPGGRVVQLSTLQLREVLGDIPLDSPEIVKWIGEYLQEQYDDFGGFNK